MSRIPGTVPDIGKRIAQQLEKYAYSVGVDRMFSDFLDYSMWAMSVGTIPMPYKCTDEYILHLHELFKLLQETEPFEDPFGGVYEYLVSSHKASKLGQFFTPAHLCELISALLIAENSSMDTYRLMEKFLRREYDYMHEPSVGSGRNVLSFVNRVRTIAHNYYVRPKNFIIAIDLDPMCVKMTAMNMVLNDIEGIIYYGDTLRLELYAAYYVCKHPILRIPHVLKLDGNSFDRAVVFMKGESKPEVKQEPPKEEQITLFNLEPVEYVKEQMKRSKAKGGSDENQLTLF